MGACPNKWVQYSKNFNWGLSGNSGGQSTRLQFVPVDSYFARLGVRLPGAWAAYNAAQAPIILRSYVGN